MIASLQFLQKNFTNPNTISKNDNVNRTARDLGKKFSVTILLYKLVIKNGNLAECITKTAA